MLVVTALVLGAMATLAAGQVKVGPAVKAAGVGTAAAKNAPYCDPKDGKLAYPYQQRAPCVTPFAKGANNGGATYQGVTKDAIKIVVVVPTHDQQVTARTLPGVSCTTPNRETGACADIEDDVSRLGSSAHAELPDVGPHDRLPVLPPDRGGRGASNAPTRSASIGMKPFGVVCNGGAAGGGRIFGLAVAQAKIMAFNCGGTNSDAVAQAPYVWLGGFDSDASAVNGAEVLGKMFVGKPAEYSGNAADKTKTRVLGVIKPSTGLSYDSFPTLLKKYGGKNGVVKTEVTYTVPVDTSTAATLAANQTEAPTLAAKLKDDGVTTVTVFASAQMTRLLMDAATKLDWYPEWFFPGFGAQDIEVTARSNDPKQMAHTFGIGSLPLYVAGINDPQVNWFNWYWGPNKGNYSAGTVGTLYTVNAGIMLAGPKLTPQTFQQGLFAMPAYGGAATDQLQSFMFGYGRTSGLPVRRVRDGGSRLRVDVVEPHRRREGQDPLQRRHRSDVLPERREAVLRQQVAERRHRSCST